MAFSDLYKNELGRVSMAMLMLWIAFLTGMVIVLGSVFLGNEISLTAGGLLIGYAGIAMANRADSRHTSIKVLGVEISRDSGDGDA